ncbi:MAG: hypothetical protein HQL53_08190 [Magnetococcales bacterium]|nr:hypothetical protein [Magnetococcales bacterium]
MTPARQQMTPTAVLLFLLALLPVIALGLYWFGQDYDPGLLHFKRGAGLGKVENAFPKRLGSYARIGPVRPYDRDNLYEYVNGHAEFFIGAGFKGLLVGEYATSADAKQPLAVVDLFDMGKPLHAFGVLMSEAGEQNTPLTLGDMAFAEGRSLIAIKGSYYLKLAAFADDVPLAEIATGVMARLKRDAAEGLNFRFPDFGAEQGTRFIKENYHGLEFLQNVIEKRFQWQDKRLKAFLVTGQPKQIAGLRRSFLQFFASDGLDVTPYKEGPEGVELLTIDDPYEGAWFLMLQKERLYGVFHPLDDALLVRIRDFVSEVKP